MGTIKIGDKKAFLLEPDKFQPVIYSAEEREIGVWTDGKPLYKKTWTFASQMELPQAGTFVDTDITQSVIENIVDAYGTASDGAFQCSLFAYNNEGTIQISTPRNNKAAYIKYLTMLYTKTTDTAGSGTWTPQGVPTHHYSTDEQVVGTWIDGSTLYERTIFENPTYSSHMTTISIGNINVHNISGGVETSSGEDNIAFGYTNYNPVEYVRAYQSGTSLSVYNSFDSSRPYVCATIQYTKSS